MKINLVSDLHLNWGDLVMPGGDILIMAGDVFDAVYFTLDDAKLEKYSGPKEVKDDYFRFIDKELSKYNHVLYVMGNHEHYNHDFAKTKDVLKSHLPSNTILLDAEVVHIDDVAFFGATLWTDFNKRNPNAIWTAKKQMNDYRVITNSNVVFGPYSRDKGRLSPDDTADDFDKAFAALQTAVKQHPKMVVITHHAPSHISCGTEYRGDLLNYAYASDLENFILDNPNIKTWVHGHMHHFNDYMIGATRVISNPRGYHGHWERSSREFDPGFSFEV